MANHSKSADRLDPAPRASTQKNYAETSPEVAKRGNPTRRTEETDNLETQSTFENKDYEKKVNPKQTNNAYRNADEDEDEESEYEDEDDSDFDDEDDSDLDEDDSDFDDEDDESDYDDEDEEE